MKRRLWQPTVGLVALVLGVTLAASTAAAGGNGAQTFTQVDKNVVEVDPGNVNPIRPPTRTAPGSPGP
jgi:hypothetical protein